MTQTLRSQRPKMFLAMAALTFWVTSAQGFESQGRDSDHRDPQDYKEYFKIESSSQILRIGFMSVEQIGEDFAELIEELKDTKFPLLRWKKFLQQPEEPSIPYNRKRHFGNWRRVGESCVNVRAQVLIRDSEIPVQMREGGCSVESGQWSDPYTGKVLTSSSEIDIDHFVPLRNAYISGGFSWSREKFCRYGNFLKNQFHLIPVDAHENRKKSDLTPADYLPPNQQFLCEYAVRWLKIKTIWGLVMMPPEAEAIQKIIAERKCDPSVFHIPEEELEFNKRASESDRICSEF